MIMRTVAIVLVVLAFGGPSTVQAQECLWTNSFSEENPPSICPQGYAARGLRCEGRYCDRKNLLCCRYMTGFDRDARFRWSRWFSEERPNSDDSREEFMSGLACQGRYCDNIRIQYMRSRNLVNSRNCRPIGYFISEEAGGNRRNQADCGEGRFAAGLACSGKYCDNLELYCCDKAR